VRVLLALLLVVADTGAVRDVTVAPGEVLRTTSEGSGRAVVLVPGLFGSAYSWRNVVARLTRDGYRTIVVEPLGTGASGHPANADYSLTAQADRIAAALDSLGVKGAVVAAQSVAASMVLRMAARHPALVKGVVSIDGGPIESAATPGLRHAMKFAPLLKLFMGAGTIRKKLRAGMLRNSGDPSWITDEVIHGYTDPAKDVAKTIDAFHGMARSKEPERLADHLRDIRAPVRLMVGGVPHESGVGDDEIAEMKAGLPDFAVDSVAGSGQYIQEENPDAVTRVIVGLAGPTLP
jgi:pimeloyl-ACP methyl ester carboxylesterase